MSYFWRAATTIWLWTYWFAATLFRVIALALGLLVLAVYIAPDFFPKRRSKQLTYRPPRKLPHPKREGSDILLEMPDGSVIQVEPAMASILAQEWAEVIAGAFVYEKTRLRDDTEDVPPHR